MTIQSLIKRVCDMDRRVDDEDESLYLRAVLVCVAHTLVLGLDTRVQPWLWVLVDDLATFDRFPWGAYSYKMLCHYTHEIGTGEKYHFYGPSWALYVWALERVPDFGHMVAASSGDPTAHPRCLRWTFRGKPRLHGLRDLFEGQGGVLPLEPDGDDLSNHYFISALTPGELSEPVRHHPRRSANSANLHIQSPPFSRSLAPTSLQRRLYQSRLQTMEHNLHLHYQHPPQTEARAYIDHQLDPNNDQLLGDRTGTDLAHPMKANPLTDHYPK
ncbi:uncharacterized protein LOC130993965 [Salvia miltiorrhiza]|uniref:uncharacterized protein LOC130993965 n=1 Tax=Salvia miltiorrhiza TaxID=226208 RepID=UPI0025AD5D68|nr:uncharacterized protein LOC130993965 [Salvia miltiorrhiza]